jgi:AAA15 family ATPase/GTPase
MEPLAKVKEYPNNCFEAAGNSLLKSTLLYGRNSAGKSNILKAFKALEYLVSASADFKSGQKIEAYEPFLYDESTRNEATQFIINFIGKDEIKYCYEIAFNKLEILRESLHYFPNKVKSLLYLREATKPIKYGSLRGNKKDIEKHLYKNQLFLSKVGTERLEQLLPAYEFFSKYLHIQVIHDTDYDNLLIQMLKEQIEKDDLPKFRENINMLLREADTGIESLVVRNRNVDEFKFPNDISDEVKQKIIEKLKTSLKTQHNIYKNDEIIDIVELPLEEESTGTIKFLALATVILDALHDGSLVIIDELDKSLHSKLSSLLVKIMHSSKNNPKHAQLIFTTHDSNLMSPDLFRRDQIWFAEKGLNGETEIFSLGDLTNVRKGIDYEKYYKEGAFGAIPVINEHNINLQF